jgi:hypothetical protein
MDYQIYSLASVIPVNRTGLRANHPTCSRASVIKVNRADIRTNHQTCSLLYVIPVNSADIRANHQDMKSIICDISQQSRYMSYLPRHEVYHFSTESVNCADIRAIRQDNDSKGTPLVERNRVEQLIMEDTIPLVLQHSLSACFRMAGLGHDLGILPLPNLTHTLTSLRIIRLRYLV